jgi:hypothetical protein
MSTLSNFIASIGQNQKFILFMAHSGFAYFVVSLFSGLHQYIAAGICLVVFAAKEFWFDVKYELNQTIADGANDFSGYVAGIAIALLVAHFML